MSSIQKEVTLTDGQSQGDQEESPTVINLSGVSLENNEINLLSRGLSFRPTPRQANIDVILDNLEGYFRRLRLKEVFLEEDEHIDDNAETQEQFRPLANGCLRKVQTLPLKHTSKRSGRTWNAI